MHQDQPERLLYGRRRLQLRRTSERPDVQQRARVTQPSMHRGDVLCVERMYGRGAVLLLGNGFVCGHMLARHRMSGRFAKRARSSLRGGRMRRVSRRRRNRLLRDGTDLRLWVVPWLQGARRMCIRGLWPRWSMRRPIADRICLEGGCEWWRLLLREPLQQSHVGAFNQPRLHRDRCRHLPGERDVLPDRKSLLHRARLSDHYDDRNRSDLHGTRERGRPLRTPANLRSHRHHGWRPRR